MGYFSSPSSLKSLQRRRADAGNGWASFKRGASTRLIIQGRAEQINKSTLMYGEVDNMYVSGAAGRTQTHTCTGSGGVLYQFPESDTRCQWNATQGFVIAATYQCKFLCFCGGITASIVFYLLDSSPAAALVTT